MNLSLNSIFTTLKNNYQNPNQFCNILLNFLQNFDNDFSIITNFKDQDLFPLFDYLLRPLIEIHFLKIRSPENVAIIQKILDYSFILANIDPAIHSFIYEHCNIEEFLNSMFNSILIDYQSQFSKKTNLILSFLKFTTLLVSKPSLQIVDSHLLNRFLTFLIDCAKIEIFAPWAMSIFSFAINYSSNVASMFILFPDASILRSLVGQCLTSDDPFLVLSSLSTALVISPNSVDISTAIELSYRVILSQDCQFPKYNLSFMILNSLIQQNLFTQSSLSDNDIVQFINTIVSCGSNLKIYHAFNFLIDNFLLFPNLPEIIMESALFFPMMDLIMDLQYPNFVSFTVYHFLLLAFPSPEKLSDEIFSLSRCSKALQIDESQNSKSFDDYDSKFLKIVQLGIKNLLFQKNSIEKREVIIQGLRFLISIRFSLTYIVDELKSRADELLIDFQRQIENAESFLSVEYFLFFIQIVSYIPELEKPLLSLVFSSPLCAFVSNVLSQSKNRSAISDALLALHIILNGLKINISNKLVNLPIFEQCISGFLAVNLKRDEILRNQKIQSSAIQKDYASQIRQLEVERDCAENEIQSLKEYLGQSQQSFESENEKSKRLIKTNKAINNQLMLLQSEKEKLLAKQKELKDQVSYLQKQINNYQRPQKKIDPSQNNMQMKLNSISKMEAEIKIQKNKIQQLNKQLNEANAINQQNKVDKEKYNKLKAHYLSNKEKMQKLRTQAESLEKENEELRKQVQINDDNPIKLKIEHESSVGSSSSLNFSPNSKSSNDIGEIESNPIQIDTNIVQQTKLEDNKKATPKPKLKKKKEKIVLCEEETQVELPIIEIENLQKQNEQIETLQKQNQDYQLLLKLIHKTTDSRVEPISPILEKYLTQ